MVHALLSYVGWGIISSVTASYLARCALDDGARHPELSALAHIGTSGAHIQNSRRDLLRHFCKFTTVPKPLVGNFTTLSKRHREEITQQSILSLPEVLEGLYVNHRDQLFNEFLGANPRQFWEALDPDDPKLATIAEVTATPGWQDITWPFVLHGDGGVYTRKTESSILVVSSKSLLSKDFECNIIPGFVLPKDIKARDTADDMWTVFVHGLNSAFGGVHAMTDAHGNPWNAGSPQAALAGTPLCGGLVRIVLWILTGDLDFLSNDLRFPSYNSLSPCWFCPVSRVLGSPCNFMDWRTSATWKAQLLSAAYHAYTPVTRGHPVDNIKGFSRFNAPGDMMHTGCAGVCAYTCGSVLAEFMFDGTYQGNQEDRLDALQNELTTIYEVLQTKNRVRGLTLSMFWHGHDAWPCFTGKAADSRSLVPVLLQMCRAFNTGSDRDAHRIIVLERIKAIYDCIFRHGHHIPRNEAEQMLSDCDEFLLHYNWLCNHAASSGTLLYNIVIKFNMFWHICYHARFLNPRSSWCYEWEDFVGAMITTARACMAGTPLRLVGPKVLQNWLLILNLRVHGW